MGMLESLERRQMFSATDASVTFGDGTLTVRGSADADRVHFAVGTRVRRDADGQRRSVETVTASLIRIADGQTLASATFESRKLKYVVASLGGGADKFKAPSLGYVETVDGATRSIARTIRCTVDGGGGDDRLEGGASSDRITGGKGNDSITGGPGNDVLSGGDGNDTIFAGRGDDAVFGDNGDDLLYDDGSYATAWRKPAQYARETGRDVFDGGAGRDVLWAAGRLNPATGFEVRRNPGSPETDVPFPT